MRTASISFTKNSLSAILEEVRQGETVMITDRRRPIATIERFTPDFSGDAAGMEELVRSGAVTPPRRSLDVADFFAGEIPRLGNEISASELIVAERREGR